MAGDTEIGSVTVGVVPDASGIEQKLRDQIVPGAERVGDEAGQEMSDAIEEQMATGGDKSASRFETSFKTRLKKALDSLPEAKIDGDISDVERKLAEIRLEIEAISEAPLVDKAQTAASLDAIMLKVAAIKDEASGIDVNISDQAKNALNDLETNLAKIRGKAITGALVPGGMFSRIPFGATPKVTVAAAQPEVAQQAVEVAGETMDDIFNEFRALQAARETGSAARRPSFANIPLEFNEMVRDITSMKPGAQSRTFAAGRGGIADIIEGVVREVMPTSPFGGATFVSSVDGLEKAAFSMSKEVELFRKPVGDIVKYSESLGGYSKDLVRLEKSAVTTTTQDIVKGAGFGSKFFSFIAKGLGISQPAGLLGTWMGRATGAVGATTGAASTAYTSTGGLLSNIAGYFVHGITGPTPSDVAAMEKAAEVSGANSQTAKVVNTTLSQVMASWIKGIFTSADKMPKTSLVADDLAKLESRLKSGVPLTGDLSKFAAFIKNLEKQKKDVSNIGDLLLQFGQGGGSIGGVLTGAGIAPGGAAGGGGGGAGLLSGAAPWIVGGIAAVAPFIAQVIAGGVISGLGIGMAGFSFAGALQKAGIKNEFTSIGKQFSGILGQTGEQFVPVIQSILKNLSGALKTLQPFFSAASAIISIPMQNFLDTIVKSLATPQVQNAIEAIAIAFGQILNAITPDVAGGMSSIADSVTRLADVVAQNPKAFADFINFLFELAIGIINVTAALTGFANFLEQGKFGQNIAAIGHFFYQLFDPNSPLNKGDPKVFSTIERNIKITFADIGGFFTGIGKGINTWVMTGFGQEWSSFQHWLWSVGKDIVNGVWHGIDLGISAGGKWVYNHFVKPFVDFFTSMQYGFGTASPAKRMVPIGEDIVNGVWQGILNIMKSAGSWIYANIYQPVVNGINSAFSIVGHTAQSMVDIGMDIVQGLYQGILNAIKGIDSWIDANVYQPVVKAIRTKFQIGSPAKATIPLGKQIVQGVIQGIISEGKNITGFITDVFGGWPQALAKIIEKGIVSLAKLPAKTVSMLYNLGKGATGAAKNAWNTIFGFLSGGGAPPGVGTTAGEMANGRQIYQYLLKNLFGGNKIAAAGATASIWGESAWNPFAQGTGGRGLIGWTPAGTISNAAFSGGMATQLPAIINFVKSSGDMGVINEMMKAGNVTSAAYLWGKGVERYGISDVHSTGISLASSFMDQGGWLPPGVTMAINNTGKPELVLTAEQASALGGGGPEYHAHFDGLTAQAIQSEVRTAFQMMSLTQGQLSRPGRRS
jgi:hypothetical protein